MPPGSHEGKEIDGEIEDLLEIRASIEACRYLQRGRHLIKITAHRDVLFSLTPKQFKQATRMTHETFDMIIDVIKGTRLNLGLGVK